jgi:dTDP-4-dehydrorhamnose 3,5-epimerase
VNVRPVPRVAGALLFEPTPHVDERGFFCRTVVDLRPGSPTYRNWESFELRGDEQVSLYIPAGCAHGFQALTEVADVSYRIDRAHDPAEDVAIAFDDEELAIPWPLPAAAVSPRDRAAPPLAIAEKSLLP